MPRYLCSVFWSSLLSLPESVFFLLGICGSKGSLNKQFGNWRILRMLRIEFDSSGWWSHVCSPPGFLLIVCQLQLLLCYFYLFQGLLQLGILSGRRKTAQRIIMCLIDTQVRWCNMFHHLDLDPTKTCWCTQNIGTLQQRKVLPLWLNEVFGFLDVDMDVSENSGTPKSSILIWFSIINHPFWGTPIFGNTHIKFCTGKLTIPLVTLVSFRCFNSNVWFFSSFQCSKCLAVAGDQLHKTNSWHNYTVIMV